MDGQPPFKRKGDFSATSSRKTPKLTEAALSGKMSFAQRMMAKMGHVAGQGLGKAGEGIVNPIEVKLRPQGAGVGAVKEKTEQYKAEQRRAAEQRGEEFEDSSEEERKARRKRKEKSKQSGGRGEGVGVQKRKTKYRTVEEVRAAAPGLELPRAMLGSIVDATGNETKLLTSTAGLMTGGMVKSETEEEKIKKRERLELEAFIEAWHGLQERKLHLEQHEGQLQLELTQMQDDIVKVKDVVASLAALHVKDDTTLAPGTTEWESMVTRLERLQEQHRHEIDSCGLGDAAVAALSSLFKTAVDHWEPLEAPAEIVGDLVKLRPLLGVSAHDEVTANGDVDPELRRYRRRTATTPFETLIYRIWLPKIRTACTEWNHKDPQPMIALIDAWRPVLPPFVFSNVIDQLVIPKLSDGLKSWNPKKLRHHKSSLEQTSPHVWIFPWLPHLPTYHLDPKVSTSLVSEVRRSLRHALSTWDITLGPLPGLQQWSSLLSSDLTNLLVRHVLPRLASHLSVHFEIDPSDQKMAPLDAIFTLRPFFTPQILARLLVAEFFPKLHAILYQWLVSPEVDVNEILPWLDWWKSVIPADINATTDAQKGWDQAQTTIDKALTILERGGQLSELAPPAAGPARPITKDAATARLRDEARTETGARKMLDAAVEEMTFKDVVEDWCAEQDLTLVPLREAHVGTGSPLFRITASATGRGGVVVYLRGDLVMAQRKGEKGVFEPVGLEEGLVRRAEGK